MTKRTEARKMDVAKVSNEDLENLFTDAYAEQVASLNNISEFECKCQRTSAADTNIRMEVTVTGFAGAPTLEDYKNSGFKNSKSRLKNINIVKIEREGKDTLSFRFVPDQTIALNTNDYLVVYLSI